MTKSVYLVYGDDEYRVSEKAGQIVDALVPEADRVFGLELIEGRADTAAEAEQAVDAALAALLTVGFLGGGKVVWLRDANFLADGSRIRTDEVKLRLTSLVDEIKTGLPAGQILVLTAPKVDGRSALAKTCKSAGEVHEFSMPEKGYLAEQQAGNTLRSHQRKLKLEMAADVQTAFLEKVGPDTRQLVNELQKLAAYLGDRVCVELRDVEAITSSSRGAMAWDLADAFGKRELAQAIRILRCLLFSRESPIGLIMGLESRLRDLMVYREALDRRWLRSSGGGRYDAQWNVPADVDVLLSEGFERDPRKTHPFRSSLLLQQAARFSMRELRRGHAAVRAAHEKLVSSSVPPELVLEPLLIRLLG